MSLYVTSEQAGSSSPPSSSGPLFLVLGGGDICIDHTFADIWGAGLHWRPAEGTADLGCNEGAAPGPAHVSLLSQGGIRWVWACWAAATPG